MSHVRATYRLQFRNGFGFAAAAEIADYLAGLGVSHLYASPIFKAVPGSTHGYDVTDFNEIEPALGGLEGFFALSAALERHGLGLILDFVPNHMAASWENPWWRAALAEGPEGAHGKTFDIDWARGDGRVVLPVLGAPLDEVLAKQELAVVRDAEGFALAYHDRRFPLNRKSLGLLPAGDPADVAAAASRDSGLLARIVEAQYYRLAFWRDGPREINYRRFFEIDDLAALRMDRVEVFEAAHALLLDLIGRGVVGGVRLDHVDGLADPGTYLTRLRAAIDRVAGKARIPIWVEKILGENETLRGTWPVAGTTGYEFASALARLQTDADGLESLTTTYKTFTGEKEDFPAIAMQAKRELLNESFISEFDALVHLALELIPDGAAEAALRAALAETLAAFPVYRAYLAGPRIEAADCETLRAALAAAEKRLDADGRRALARIESLVEHPERQTFFTRFEQLSSALTAKAVEDTAFYRYAPLVSLNEVGGAPEAGALCLSAFHRMNEARLADWPDCLIATSSHDTKRGEDVRARLAVLSEEPTLFADAARRWWRAHRPTGIRPKDAWILYQTLLGIWPAGVSPDDAQALARLGERLEAYAIKAAREAKQRTSWTDADAAYEEALKHFARRLVDPRDEAGALTELCALVEKIAPAGAVNGLAQLLLKLAAPGVPDLYQGSEYWDLNLVDPDNRRPVDFAARRKSLAENSEKPLADLLPDWRGGAVKQALMARVLELRRIDPALFARGEYIPIEAHGSAARHIVAFARLQEGRAAVAAAIRRPLSLLKGDTIEVDPGRLRDTCLAIPEPLTGAEMCDWLGRIPISATAEMACADLFARLPVALLIATGTKNPAMR